MPLFRLVEKKINRLRPGSFVKERDLQRLFEGNLEELLGIRFIASEFATGEKHGGRIDTLGLDDNNCPVIIEYKLASKDNIINQGLFYLDWLLDHKGDYEMAVHRRYGAGVTVSWDYARLILIAQEFSKYDRYAVEQIGRAVELKSYRLYEGGFLYLEDVYSSPLSKTKKKVEDALDVGAGEGTVYTIEDHLNGKPAKIKLLFSELRERILNLGDNVVEKPVKLYIGYATTRNFCEINIQKGQIKLFLDLPYAYLKDDKKVRDVHDVGRWGTGDCEVILKDEDEIQRVTDLIKKAYDYHQ